MNAIGNISAIGTGHLARLGLAMRRYRGVIIALQWGIVLSYLVLVALPAFLPLPPDQTHVWNNLTRFAQFAFWGIWWPFVILSMMLLGRMWCGVLCPEGALTEWVSRYGLGRGIPRWMKWGGWPFVAFVMTTVFGQMTSVYEYPKPALLILGGSTIAAIAAGLVWGREK
ncbi:MAG TPA: 4Fe-4S binding protein, partial [Thiobacillus sp.]